MLMRRSDLLTRDVNGEVVILDRAGGRVHQLNATASHIWDACDGQRSVSEIAESVAANFEGVPPTVVRDVAAILTEFGRLGLLVDSWPVDDLNRVPVNKGASV